MDFHLILIGVFGLALLGLFIYIGVASGDQDTTVQVNKNISIVAGVTTALSFIFGLLTFFYFSVNTDYITPFLLISNSVNLTLALVAVGISSLRVRATA
jgi:hypothetical protein